ncbi:MAG: B12-binding domain-containing radical SAM protein, partial [Candidatus Omnitrophota bacterium]|nr:B12-binding domain-containing radical SAM protein [Candidatus Omnitrophota bacterium]
MSLKVLIVNPPVYTPKPWNGLDTSLMGPYVLASQLKPENMEIKVFDFVSERRGLDGWEDVRVERVAKVGNYKKECLQKRIYYMGSSERHYIDYVKAYRPNIVLISCLFTFYWEGAKLVYDLTRDISPLILITIGGNYPALCPEHARANFPEAHVKIYNDKPPDRFFNIDLGFYNAIPRMFPILTSVGCPFSCKWCAVPFLEGNKMQFKDPRKVVEDMETKYRLGVRSFRFIDSHLLADYENHFKAILEELVKKPWRAELHSYGGLNSLYVTQEMLELMAEAGFVRIQLPIETSDEKTLKDNNRPVSAGMWEAAVKKLKRINRFQVVSYVLAGLPGQTIEDIYRTINFVEGHGVTPVPLFFTPIPTTRYEDPRPLEDLHPYLFPCASDDMPASELERIQEKYYTGGVHVSEIIKGSKTVYESGPA